MAHFDAYSLILASLHLERALLVIPPPPADTTGVDAAFIALARRLSAIAGGVIMLYLVYHGIAYMGTDEASRGSHIKRMLTVVAISAITILAAVTIAPQLVTAIITGK